MKNSVCVKLYPASEVWVPKRESVCWHEQALITNTSRYTDADILGAATSRNVLKASHHTQRPSLSLPPARPLSFYLSPPRREASLSQCSLSESPGSQSNRCAGPGRVQAAAKSWPASQHAWQWSLLLSGSVWIQTSFIEMAVGVICWQSTQTVENIKFMTEASASLKHWYLQVQHREYKLYFRVCFSMLFRNSLPLGFRFGDCKQTYCSTPHDSIHVHTYHLLMPCMEVFAFDTSPRSFKKIFPVYISTRFLMNQVLQWSNLYWHFGSVTYQHLSPLRRPMETRESHDIKYLYHPKINTPCCFGTLVSVRSKQTGLNN